MTDDDLLAAVLEIEGHVASDGWDQPTLLFALVPTAQIRRDQPALAPGSASPSAGPALTTFEQPPPPLDKELDAFLAGISWPDEIAGAAVVVERIVLPPDAEADDRRPSGRGDASPASTRRPGHADRRGGQQGRGPDVRAAAAGAARRLTTGASRCSADVPRACHGPGVEATRC